MRIPIIGVSPLYDAERDSCWMLPGYMQGLEEAGAAPVMLPLTKKPDILRRTATLCDGFLLTGGQDVSPRLYGSVQKPYCGETCAARDGMELILLRMALEEDKPVFGICRGLQFLNAALGGTLYQDIPTEYPTHVDHCMTPPYSRAVHTVNPVPGSPLAALLGDAPFGVNSYHHQAIRTLAPGLDEMARAEDGLIEAACVRETRFVWAVQWHPEFSFRSDANSRLLLRAFVRAAEKRR